MDCVVAGRDPDGAGGLFPKFTQRFKLGFDLLKARAHVTKQAFAPFRWRDAARGASQQSNPRRASSPRMVWLSADWETPSFAAAFVKLRSRPTARKAMRSFRFPRCIYGICS